MLVYIIVAFPHHSKGYSVLHVCSSWWSSISTVDHGENSVHTSLDKKISKRNLARVGMV